jgi:hypothetical protein
MFVYLASEDTDESTEDCHLPPVMRLIGELALAEGRPR